MKPYQSFIDKIRTTSPRDIIKYIINVYSSNISISKNMDLLLNYLKPSPTDINSELGTTEANSYISDMDTIYNNYKMYLPSLQVLDDNILTKLKELISTPLTSLLLDTDLVYEYNTNIRKYATSIKYGNEFIPNIINCMYENIHASTSNKLNKNDVYSLLEGEVIWWKNHILETPQLTFTKYNNLQKYGLYPFSQYSTPVELSQKLITRDIDILKDTKSFIKGFNSQITKLSKEEEGRFLQKYKSVGLIIMHNIFKNNTIYDIQKLINHKPSAEFQGLNTSEVTTMTTILPRSGDKFQQSVFVSQPDLKYYLVVEVLSPDHIRLLAHSRTSSLKVDLNQIQMYSKCFIPRHYLLNILQSQINTIPIGKNNALISKLDTMMESSSLEPMDETELILPHEFRFKVVNRMMDNLKFEMLLQKKKIMNWNDILQFLTSEDTETEFKNSVMEEYIIILKHHSLDKHVNEVNLTFIANMFTAMSKFKRNINESVRGHYWTTPDDKLFERVESSKLEIIDNIRSMIQSAIIPIITLDGLSDTVIAKARLMEKVSNQ